MTIEDPERISAHQPPCAIVGERRLRTNIILVLDFNDSCHDVSSRSVAGRSAKKHADPLIARYSKTGNGNQTETNGTFPECLDFRIRTDLRDVVGGASGSGLREWKVFRSSNLWRHRRWQIGFFAVFFVSFVDVKVTRNKSRFLFVGTIVFLVLIALTFF